MSASASVVVPRRTALADYLELTKPRITLTVVMTALVGYVMGTRGPVSFSRLAVTLAGLGILRFGAGPLAALVALVTWATYLFAYTPLKTRTSLSTIVGAFPGALPPVIGWAAARGQIEPGAVVLFAILFLWQIPHFLAIAWIYREDYARGGLPMLPVLDPAGVVTGRQAVANSLALLLVSVVPTIAGLTGRLYFIGAVGLGVAFTSVAVWSAIRRTAAAARGLFLASILYLLALCTLLLVDRV